MILLAVSRHGGRLVLAGLAGALAGQGLEVFGYHTTSADPDDKVVSAEGVQPDTGRGAIDDGAAIDVLSVGRVRQRDTVPAGTWFIDLAQPFGSLAAAALEPDSQNSFAASRLIAITDGRLRRVMSAPPPGALESPAP